MIDAVSYTPPAVWVWNKSNGGHFANINRPTAGATHDKDLPVGRHPLQLYSLATPNSVKVTVMLEELLALGHAAAEYDAWLIKINDGDQFGSGFVALNPTSKIPAQLDRQLATNEYIAGADYTIADIAIWPWYGALANGGRQLDVRSGSMIRSRHRYNTFNPVLQ